MFDPASIGAALTSLRALIEIGKNVNDAQLAMKISREVSEIQGKLLDVQQQAIDLQSENADLKAELQALKQDAMMVLEGDVYWQKRADGGFDGPFCPACWGLNNKRVPLVKNEHRNHQDYVVYECHHHQAAVAPKAPKTVLAKYGK